MTIPTIALLVSAVIARPAAARAYTPDYARIRSGLDRTAARHVVRGGSPTFLLQATPSARVTSGQRDSVWNGLLIGAAAGGVGGYIWARHECGDDQECAAITNPVGILVGAGIGAAIGGILDAFSR
jgi:hypothetical protein